MTRRAQQTQAAATSFLALFSIVGLALYGLPLYYDFMVQEFGWSRTQVTSGNALSKLIVGPLFGFLAGWIIDRFGPRRIMLVGILLAGGALIGLGGMSALWMFYAFYLVNAIGYVCGGPLPNQVLLSQWFKDGRGKAMGFAYLGIGVGGALVPWLSYWMVQWWGWRGALRGLGVLIIVLAWPMAYFAKEAPPEHRRERAPGRHGPAPRGVSQTGVLPADHRQHVLDRGRRRSEPAPQAVHEPRCRLQPELMRPASSRSCWRSASPAGC